ncbi:MAG: CoA-binding protein [Candidatus Thorarchaeota archaeon]|nr:MAG: CoA-binding protein [Candidatus Thorarchaeota archaeon]
MNWKSKSLDRLFNPKSIAVIGASDKPYRLGALSLLALTGYDGDIFPVNPRLKTIGNLECHRTVSDIDNEIDLAIIALRAQLVLEALEDCARAEVGGAIVFTAGFKELGPAGEVEQERMKEIANAAELAVIGPNCLGAGNTHRSLNATFFPHPVELRAGTAALASQSGGVTGLMMYRAADADLGVSKFASVGNRVNVDFHDLIRYFREDVETQEICLFVEGTEYAREMHTEIESTSAEKPVIVYKVGTTPSARAAALSHTGSLAGSPELYSASTRQAGGIEVRSIEEMVDTARVFSVLSALPEGRRVAIVTHTLGPSLMAAQELEERGIVLPSPKETTSHTIRELLGLDIIVGNPIDLLATGWARPDLFATALKIASEEAHFDAIMTVFSPNFQKDIGGGMPVDDVIEASRTSGKPFVSVLVSPDSRRPPGWEELEEGGVPTFSGPIRAARALSNVMLYAERRRRSSKS